MQDFGKADRQRLILSATNPQKALYERLLAQGFSPAKARAASGWDPIWAHDKAFRKAVKWAVLAALALGLFQCSRSVSAQETVIIHVSKLTKEARARVENFPNCVKAVQIIRKQSLGRIRAFCKGRWL